MARKKLSDELKIYVIERLARCVSRRDVADELKAKFGVSVTPRALCYYRPDNRALPDKWRRFAELTARVAQAEMRDAFRAELAAWEAEREADHARA